MLELKYDLRSWLQLSYDEQVLLCKAEISEYDRISQPLKEEIRELSRSSELAMWAFTVFHDHLRIRSNLLVYCSPERLGENKSYSRFDSLCRLRSITAFLEYIEITKKKKQND